ncbi:MAG: ATP-binding protein, partial [Nanoarchaeota archaeon]
AHLGKLEGQDIDVYLDLKKLLTKHVAVLAKSGAGKSYSVGVLLEEIMDKNVPLLIIDPHGEYSTMKNPNKNEKDIKNLKKFNLKPMSFSKKIVEYGDTKINPEMVPLRLNENLDTQELLHLLPGKLSNNQMAVLYSALKNMDELSLTHLLLEIETQESNAKWSVMSVIDYLIKLDLFSNDYTSYNEIIQPGKCSIINLRGIDPVIQEIIVYKLLKDIFEERKKENIPPLFAVIEEAHNYVPERSFGEKKSSSILRTIASEGRKFGMGLCVISQRPARIEKNVLSQCTTQLILKVTNPNDLKAISNSVEGITTETESEIRNLSIGSGLVTGLVDIPLLINIRPRLSQHGGEAVDVLKEFENEDFFNDLKKFDKKEILPIIEPKISIKELVLMSEKKVKKVMTYLIPAVMAKINYQGEEFNILVDLIRGDVIKDIAKSIIVPINKIANLKECQNFDKIKFTEIPYNKKLAKKKTKQEILAPIKQKAQVNDSDSKDCYVIYHKLIYETNEEN